MAKSIENLENAFDEMFDFITDLPSGLDGFESDFDSAFEELRELKATLTPPNEPLCQENKIIIVKCKGCKYHKPIDYCEKHNDSGWYDDDFCSFGKKKE